MSAKITCKCGVSIEGDDLLQVIRLTNHHDETCPTKKENPS